MHFFGIVTTTNSPLTLIVKGSIDISNGGRICHRDGSANNSCGSGKPENLTILFDQTNSTDIAKNKLWNAPDLRYKFKSQDIPNNTFFISSTGDSFKEKFSGFVHAIDTTFSTSSLPTKFFTESIKGIN